MKVGVEDPVAPEPGMREWPALAESSLRPDDIDRAIHQAVVAWRRAIGEHRVLTETERYNLDTSSFSGRIPIVLRPESVKQVQEVVRIAQRFRVPIYPCSTGNNWGYGTSVPVRSPGVVVDLSTMNRILELDEELGVVTLEPGVTQGDLSEYLQLRDLPFLVPVTGAGPSCSVLANALERGFGVTPHIDHFGAILSMKVVLPDGTLYEPFPRSFDAAGVAEAFKWGTGPYLDGLFSQSNLGIVVDASIALQPRAERSGVLLFGLDSTQRVEGATAGIQQLLTAAGGNVGAVNLMSRSRVESMLRGARRLQSRGDEAAAEPESELPPGAWFGFGSVYGSREHYRGICRLAKRCLRGSVRNLRIYTAADVRRLRWLSDLTTTIGWPRLSGLVERLEAAMDVVEGIPSTFALPLAYAGSGRPDGTNDWNPAQDGCGLFWYSPIIPFRSGAASEFIAFAEKKCKSYGLLAPITLTALSPRCYAATLPLLFDREMPGAEKRARSCFSELLEEGLAQGFVPYRIGAQFMPDLARGGGGFWPVAESIKNALDPAQILAPGRYSRSPRDHLS